MASNSLITINQKQWREIIISHYRQPGEMIPCCLGGNGIGKTHIAYQAAEALGVEMLDVRLLTLFPTDLRGIPYTVNVKRIGGNGETVWEREVRWGRSDVIPAEGRGILFLDEITNIDGQMMAAVYELVQQRKCGRNKLGDGWQIICAGNRVQDKTGAREMITGLATRLIRLEMEPDFDLWRQWALENGLDSRLVGYLSANPHLLVSDAADGGRLRPRTWAEVGHILKHRPQELWLPLISGCIGFGQAADFVAYLDGLALPSPIDVLAGRADLPTRSADAYTVASGIAQIILKAKPAQRPALIDAFLKVSIGWPLDKGAFVGQMLRDADRETAAMLASRPGFGTWAKAYAQVLK